MVHRSSAFPSVHFWFNVLLGLLLFFSLLENKDASPTAACGPRHCHKGQNKWKKMPKKRLELSHLQKGTTFHRPCQLPAHP